MQQLVSELQTRVLFRRNDKKIECDGIVHYGDLFNLPHTHTVTGISDVVSLGNSTRNVISKLLCISRCGSGLLDDIVRVNVTIGDNCFAAVNGFALPFQVRFSLKQLDSNGMNARMLIDDVLIQGILKCVDVGDRVIDAKVVFDPCDFIRYRNICFIFIHIRMLALGIE